MLKKIIAIIPARYASTRLPAKPLVDILGKSMIQRVYEQTCMASSILHQTWVATDDKRIFDHVSNFGGRVLMTSQSHQSGTERCAEALLTLQKTIPDIDAVINVQGDEPFLNPQQIREVAQALSKGDAPIATLIRPIDNISELFDINRPKVVIDKQGKALYFSRQAIPFLRGIEPEQWLNSHVFYKHIGIYAYLPKTLLNIVTIDPPPIEQAECLEQLRWLWSGFAIQTAYTDYDSFSVDILEDLHNAILKITNAQI